MEEAQSDDDDQNWEDEDDVSTPREVNDKGFPITKDGMDKFMYLIKEIDYRDQDIYHMHIYNDWTDYGVTEVLENMVSFNVEEIEVLHERKAALLKV